MIFVTISTVLTISTQIVVYFIAFLSLAYFRCFAVVISFTKKGENNARIYDKRHSCFYCDKMCAKIARHYEHHHKDEAEVAEAFAYPRGSKDRKKALEKLRLRGNFHHNLRVLECKSKVP